jgi:hypothetical protein
MADDTKDDSSTDPRVPESKPSGTANLLHHYSQYAALEQEYDEDVPAGLLKKALERKGLEQTVSGVKSWAEISRAIVTSDVDLDQEYAQAKAKTDALADSLVPGLTQSPTSEAAPADLPEDKGILGYDPSNDDDDESYEFASEDDEDFDSAEDERSSLADIYGCENEEDAMDEAYDDMLKLLEKPD